ncbi:ABC transporter permease [Orbaceae bacterium ESL0727]|nr:ABC transporter permease [Orbaceae bacterium ESL0727]
MTFSFARTLTLCRKESKLILRDPSSLLIAVIIPLLLLFIFGYGINLDSNKLRIGVLVEQQSQPANAFLHVLNGSPYIEPIIGSHRAELVQKLNRSEIRGIVVIPVNFAQQFATQHATIQLITDGSEPNIANFVQAYMSAIWQIWLQQQNEDTLTTPPTGIQTELRYWFNSAAISQYFILPGAITIIMTVIGSILTSLVIAREWESGTMEALLSTPMTKLELLLSKLLPYYLLGLIALVICFIITVFIMHVPFRGSLLLLLLTSSLFLFTVLGLGLLISTLTRNQFNAAMIALNVAFLPSVMLSGFVFEVDSMPLLVRLATYIIPARYYVNIMQTLFLAGDIGSVLMINVLFLVIFMVLLLTITIKKTRLQLD